MEETENNGDIKGLAEYSKELFSRERENSTNYDKAILTLSTAGLGVSFSFIENIIKIAESSWVFLLKISWILFCLSIIATIVSFKTSQKAIRIQHDFAYKGYIEGKKEYFNKESSWAKITNILNFLSGIIFISAIICTVIFILINI